MQCFAALEKAKELGLIHKNPAEGCKLPPKKAREMEVLDCESMQRLLIQAREEGYYELFLLALSTGLRRGEIAALQWNDIDFNLRTVSINKQAVLVNGTIEIQTPKTKSSIRTLVLPSSVMEILQAKKAKATSQWVFPSPTIPGMPLRPDVIARRLHLILEHAGCKQVRFHDLRHTFATTALEYGMDIKTLSTILGHKTAATTIDVYAHITNEMQRNAAITIDRGIAKSETTFDQEMPQKATSQMTNFQAYTGKIRKRGTGGIHQINDRLWEGRFSQKVDGKRRARTVYAHSKGECEEKLKVLIGNMKAEIKQAEEHNPLCR